MRTRLDVADCDCADGDSDGFACVDCDDGDPGVNPGRPRCATTAWTTTATPAPRTCSTATATARAAWRTATTTDPLISPDAAEHCLDGSTTTATASSTWPLGPDAGRVRLGDEYLAEPGRPGDRPGLGRRTCSTTSVWSNGHYGVGYEVGRRGRARTGLILTEVTEGAVVGLHAGRLQRSAIAAGVNGLYLGADYDDGYVAWINGVEVYRSPEMPAGDPAWDADSAACTSRATASCPTTGR